VSCVLLDLGDTNRPDVLITHVPTYSYRTLGQDLSPLMLIQVGCRAEAQSSPQIILWQSCLLYSFLFDTGQLSRNNAVCPRLLLISSD